MPNNRLPNRASDAGPEPSNFVADWRDYLDFASECIVAANRSEATYYYPVNNTARSINRERINHINAAIDLLEKAKEELC